MRGLPVHVNTVIWKKELKKGRNKQRRRRRRRKEQESAEAISGLKNWVLLDFSSDFWLFDCQTFWAKLIKSLQRNVLLIKKNFSSDIDETLWDWNIHEYYDLTKFRQNVLCLISDKPQIDVLWK